MKLHFILLLVVIIFSSCVEKNNDKALTDGKYIKATIISTANADEMGMIEFHQEEHNDSYVALFDGADYDGTNLHKEVYAKIYTNGKIPLAKDLIDSKPDLEQLFSGSVKTSINYHSSTGHKVEGGGFHTKMHYRGGIVALPSGTGYTVDLYDSENEPVTTSPLVISEAIKLQLESYGDGIVYTELASGNLTKVDTCHRHGNRIIMCRSDD